MLTFNKRTSKRTMMISSSWELLSWTTWVTLGKLSSPMGFLQLVIYSERGLRMFKRRYRACTTWWGRGLLISSSDKRRVLGGQSSKLISRRAKMHVQGSKQSMRRLQMRTKIFATSYLQWRLSTNLKYRGSLRRKMTWLRSCRRWSAKRHSIGTRSKAEISKLKNSRSHTSSSSLRRPRPRTRSKDHSSESVERATFFQVN